MFYSTIIFIMGRIQNHGSFITNINMDDRSATDSCDASYIGRSLLLYDYLDSGRNRTDEIRMQGSRTKLFCLIRKLQTKNMKKAKE